MDTENFHQFPVFPNMEKKIRLNRQQATEFSEQKLAPVPYWKLLKTTQPVAPVPIDPERPPTVPIDTDAIDVDPVNLMLSSTLERLGYPKPPEEAHAPVQAFSRPDVFHEALHDQRKYRPYLVFAYVDDQVTADLTKFGKDRNHDGIIKISRYVMEERALEVTSGDLFLWRRQLMEVVERKEIDQMGVSSFWQNLEIQYVSFRGDSANLEIPDITDLTGIIGVPGSLITNPDGSKTEITDLAGLADVLAKASQALDDC